MLGGLLAIAAALILTVVLPLLSYRRATAAFHAIERLHRRLDALEATLGRSERRPAAIPDPSPRDHADDADRTVAEPTAAPPTRLTRSTDAPRALEARIGGRWLLYLGVAILVIGAASLVRFAFANAWVTEPVRVLIGVFIGAVLVWSGRRFSVAGHRTYGHALAGGGLAIWYLSVYAAVNLYDLVGPGAGFTMLLAVTTVGALQATRIQSQGLAMLAVAGGYATPWLVGAGTTAPLMLLVYASVLVGTTVLLAHRGDLPVLNVVSFLLTGLTWFVWALRWRVGDDYIAVEALLTLFCGLFLWIVRQMQRSRHPAAPIVRSVLWTTPLWYHLASLAVLEPHWLAYLVYLIGITSVGLLLAVRFEAIWSRLPLWGAVVVPLLAWSSGELDGSWLMPAIVTWLAIGGMHAVAQVELVRRSPSQLHPSDVLLTPASAGATYVGLRTLLQPLGYAGAGEVALPLAIAVGLIGWWIGRVDRRAQGHFSVSAVSLAAIGLMTWLGAPWAPAWLALQGGGLIWLGLGERRDWVRGIGVVLVLGAITRTIEIQFAPVPAGYDVFLNHRAGLGLLITAVLAVLAVRHARTTADADPARSAYLAASVVGANAMMLITLTAEINAFWDLRAVNNAVVSAELARQMMLSATWAAYAAALTAIGIRRKYPPVRYLALGVFAITVAKLFFVDLSQLDSVYRIISSLALGMLLVGASYLYQRYGTATEPVPPAPSDP